MQVLKVGFVGAGFNGTFHSRVFTENGGISGAIIGGVYALGGADEFVVRVNGLGQNCMVCNTVAELCLAVDVVSLSMPNYARIEILEEILAAVNSGARLKGVVCEKPLARNMKEANRVVDLIADLAKHGVRFSYFENQIHMPTVRACRLQLSQVAEKMGPVKMVRSAEEHGGPHEGWFWDPTKQGGGVCLDMGCHSVGVGWYMLTPNGKPIDHLVPVSVNANLELIKWGNDPWRSKLLAQRGVDYTKTPAEDYALIIVKFRDPETGQIVVAQATDSWMYDAPGLRLLMEAYGGGYSYEVNTLLSPSSIFISDAAAAACADAELALEKSQASHGHLIVLPDEPLVYGYTSEWVDALNAFRQEKDGMLGADFGRDVVKILMAAYLSAERGKTINLVDPEVQDYLKTYVPLIQKGRGGEVLFPPMTF